MDLSGAVHEGGAGGSAWRPSALEGVPSIKGPQPHNPLGFQSTDPSREVCMVAACPETGKGCGGAARRNENKTLKARRPMIGTRRFGSKSSAYTKRLTRRHSHLTNHNPSQYEIESKLLITEDCVGGINSLYHISLTREGRGTAAGLCRIA